VEVEVRHVRLVAALFLAALGARLLSLAHRMLPRPTVERFEVDGAALVPARGWVTLVDPSPEEVARSVAILEFGKLQIEMARRFQRAAPERARA
jgi:hypothetical protein